MCACCTLTYLGDWESNIPEPEPELNLAFLNLNTATRGFLLRENKSLDSSLFLSHFLDLTTAKHANLYSASQE